MLWSCVARKMLLSRLQILTGTAGSNVSEFRSANIPACQKNVLFFIHGRNSPVQMESQLKSSHIFLYCLLRPSPYHAVQIYPGHSSMRQSFRPNRRQHIHVRISAPNGSVQKNARAGKFDLHPHLCDERHITALLEGLRPYAEAAGILLDKAGIPAKQIKKLIGGLKKLSSCDPWISYHFNHQNGPNIHLSPEWRQLASHINENELRRLLALRGRLPIEQNTALHAACAWLAINENGLEWLELIASIPAEQQVPFATMAAWNSSPALKPGQINPEFMTIHAGILQSQYLHCAATYLSGLADGLLGDYLMAGFRLARAWAPNHSFRLPLRSSPVPEQLLNDIAARIIEECNYFDWLMMAIWRSLGTLPGLAEFLKKIPWTDLSPSGIVELLRFFVDFAPDYSESVEERIAIWREIQKPLLSAISGMKNIPLEHQKNWANMLGSALCDVQPSKISKQIKPLIVLVHRLSHPPFPETTHLGYAIEPFWRTDDEEVREAFITAPDDSFLRFEKTCSRPGAGGLIGYSMKAVVQHMPHFAIEAFIQFS